MPSLNTENAILSNAIKVDSSYNVGIGGAASGSFKLQVTGTSNLTGALTISGNLNLQGAVTRNINFYDSSNTNINAQIQYDQIASNSGQLFFGTNNAGTFATRLTIASTGAATFSSSASSGQNLRLQTSIAAGRNYVQWANGSGDMGYIGYGGADGKFWINNQLADDMLFHNNGSERMRITSGGNVGIGTNSPSVTLDTFLNTGTGYQLVARFLGGTNANGNAGGIALGSTQTIAGYIYGLQTASNGGDLVFGTQSSGAYTERMRITSGGNVQINGPVYRYSGQTVVGGSFTNLTAIDLSSSRTYLIQMIPTNTEAGMSYRIFGVIQANATSGTYVFSSIHSQTMDITFSGTTVQARVTNSQQWTFNWSITQLL